MFKSLIFQLFTIWVYILFCCGLLWCKILNLFVNMEWAIKLLYLAMNLICENVIKIEENWMNKFICSKHCAKVNEDDDDTESFDDFIKKIKSDTNQNFAHMNPNINFNNNPNQSNQIPPQTTNNFSTNNTNNNNSLQNNNSNYGNVNSAHISTLNFPNPNGNTNFQSNVNYNDGQRSQYHSNSVADEIDHEKIKRLIDKMYMKSIIEENEDDPDADAITNKASMFSRRSKERDGRQIIFSRGVREVENNVPEPNY